MLIMGDEMRKRYITEFILCFVFGWLGVHKFYERKIGIGILYIFTCGLFSIGWIIDIIKLFKLAFLSTEDEIKQKNIELEIESQRRNEEKIRKQEEFNRIMASKPTVEEKEIKNNPVHCPKCKCTSIAITNKKLSLGRAATGGFLFGTAGAMVGGVTSKKMFNVCQGCGHRWQPGKR